MREHKQWNGILFDSKHSNHKIKLQKKQIVYTTAIEIFQEFKIPFDLDLLVVNPVYDDYWILDQLLSNNYKPKVIVHEINHTPPNECTAVLRNENKSSNIGTSLCAFYCLAQKYDYTMIYCESSGDTCFWVNNFFIKNSLKFDVKFFQKVLNATFLYKRQMNNNRYNNKTNFLKQTEFRGLQVKKCY